MTVSEEPTLWVYRGYVDRLVDADTASAVLDLGFHVWIHARLRLAGVDAPERYTPEGAAATAWLGRELDRYDNQIYVWSLGRDNQEGDWQPDQSFARWIANVSFRRDGELPRDVGAALVAAGHAAYRGEE